MALLCLPKHLVEKLKQSALRGEVDIRKLYKMSSKERRAFFEKYTDAELGTFLNVEFEKAMVSRQQNAMLEWAKGVFTPQAKEKPVYKTVLDKIAALDEMGVLTPESEAAFLEDLVADKLGINVTPEEVRNISERAAKIQEAQEKLGEDLGNPQKREENLAFFKAKKSMDDYLLSLTPAPKVRVLTGTIGRGMMLMSVKSPLLNIGSNLEIGLAEAFVRRVSSGKVVGTNNGLAKSFVSMARKIYRETGYDISRMRKLSDTGASGARVLGEDMVHTKGVGKFMFGARFVEDLVFKNMLGAPDAAFASIHFADSVNLNATKLAKGNKSRAEAFMLDAMRIQPQTAEGEILREQAILDAEYATWTNVSKATEFSEGIRAQLNNAFGDARLGDLLLPFVRTPSNVIKTGIDYAGWGFPKALVHTYNAFKTGNLKSKEHTRAITQDVSRAGFGLVAAYLISSLLGDDDFVGAYDPRRKQIEQLRNSRENSIRVGGKWISVDWLGPLAVPLTAMMYARVYADEPRETVFQYLRGMALAILELPPIDWAADAIKSYEYKKNQTFDEMVADAKNTLIGEASARIVPSIFSDLAKAIDPKVRDTTGLSGFKKVASSLPFLSNNIPAKKNIWGEELMGEPIWTDILFGARVRTDKETPLVVELNRVSNAVDKGVTFTDWSVSSSKTLSQFRSLVGSVRYEEARTRYGQILKASLEKIISDPQYAKLSDEDKYRLLTGKDTDAIEQVLKEYQFKYKTEKATKLPNL